jgi:stringent starvation protein B
MHETPISKEAVVVKLLEEGDTMLCLDARCQGVRVPAQHTHDPALRLVLNMNFPQPIDITAAGISARLSFGGRRFACFIPMTALWAAFNPHTMQGMMWPESMPPEVVQDLAEKQLAGKQQTTADSQESPQQPHGRTDTGQRTAETPEETPHPPRQRGHLRIIK